MHLYRHLAIGLCLCLAPGLVSYSTAQEDGQYRSRIRLDPDNTLGQGAGIPVEELERQIGAITDAYAKSSAGRHLARHYVEQGDYPKAIEYYRTALAARGLSDIANREMLRELAQVYLLSENYAAAAESLEKALNIDLAASATDYLLLAQAYYRLGRLVQVVDALDRIREQGLTLTLEQKRQALALYYQAGAYAQCELLLKQLLDAQPHNPDNWHQLASVYLQQGKRREALDQLTLAWEKSVPFREPDTLLFADLHAVNGNPLGAAEILDRALRAGAVEGSARNYRKLFEFWLQARERDRAVDALAQAASRSGETELYLYLAQLRMEQEDWQAMYQTMQAACARQLQDRFVSRANLLLGISQLKLGDRQAARRSFINATLIGGAGAQAGQWLEYMNAEPATASETRRIESICYGARDKQGAAAAITADSGAGASTADDGEPPGNAVAVKTVDRIRFFYQDYEGSLAELAAEAKSLAVRMTVSMIKSGGSADGPLQIIATGEPGGKPALQLALPAKGAPRASGKYSIRQSEEFRCAYLLLAGPTDSLGEAWKNLVRGTRAAGHELSGETRLVFHNSGGEVQVELQVGIE